MKCDFQPIPTDPTVVVCSRCERRAKEPIDIECGGLSAFKRAVSLATSVIDHAIHGLKKVDEQKFKKRMAICKECPLFAEGLCQVCGCYTEIKLRWAEQKCPLDKWGAE